jgi:Tfp pilus assembly protein PilN
MSTINLLPEDYVRRSARRRANVMCLVLFAISMAAVVTAALVSERSSRHTRQVRDQVDDAYTYAARQIQQMQQLEARKQSMLAKAEAISSLLERVPRSHLLGVIANAMPENTSLTRLDLDTKRLVVAAPAPAAGKSEASKFDALSAARSAKALPSVVTLELTGLAGTDVEVARLIANLARNPLIAAVDLIYSQEKIIDKQPVREFQVHLELRTGADALADMPETVAHGPAGAENPAGVGP